MPSLESWLPIKSGSPFSLQNLPFGIVTYADKTTPRAAVAIGEHCLDLLEFSMQGGFGGIEIDTSVFSEPSLNAFAALGRKTHKKVREYLQDIFSETTLRPGVLRDNWKRQTCLVHQNEVVMHLPMKIGDYTDFYAGKHHAFNVGCLFRGPSNALQPNYTHLPVGYHGRASSVVVSGTPIKRPNGQILEASGESDGKKPILAPSRRLDIELELGAFICKSNPMGQPVPIHEAADYIFGFVLLNDWSARDIQQWEYVPLGPFNSKNFGTTISPWVVLVDALEPFKTNGIENDNKLLPYLKEEGLSSIYDVQLEVEFRPSGGRSTCISRSNGKYLIFSFAQMIAHHTIGGCQLSVGDLLGSGTISGPEKGTEGSILEITRGGKERMLLNDGVERSFLEDGDTITIHGVCGTDPSALVGFGECVGTIVPSPSM